VYGYTRHMISKKSGPAMVPHTVDLEKAASASAPLATSSLICDEIHSNVFFSPSASLTDGAHPSFSFTSSLLELRPRTPCGMKTRTRVRTRAKDVQPGRESAGHA